MPRALTVVPHLTAGDVAARAQQASDPIARRRWRLLLLVAQGTSVPEAAGLVGYSATWARVLVHRYNTDGPDGLGDRRRHNPGRAPLLSPALRAELAEALTGPAPGGGTWTSATVAAWMSARLGRPVAPVRGWETLRALGFTLHRYR